MRGSLHASINCDAANPRGATRIPSVSVPELSPSAIETKNKSGSAVIACPRSRGRHVRISERRRRAPTPRRIIEPHRPSYSRGGLALLRARLLFLRDLGASAERLRESARDRRLAALDRLARAAALEHAALP